MIANYKLTIVDIGSTFAAFLYDLGEKRVIWEVTDYSDKLIERLHLKKNTINQEIGHLREFWGFLKNKTIAVETINEDAIKKFRDYAIEKAKKSISYRGGGDDAINTTVNAKLVRIYDWLLWLQESGQLPSHTIGYHNARVPSALFGSSLSRDSKKNKDIKAEHKYPLLLNVKTKRSKHSVAKYIPTESTVDSMHEIFMRKGSAHIRHRNALLVDVAAYTGFRRNSIQSLQVNQFIGKDFVVTNNDTVIIKPSRQKFDYGNTFEIPLILHNEIRRFIETYRKELIESKGLPTKTTNGAVFISDRTCTPLDDRTITSVMSKALRAVGAPKGTAGHSFRAKFIVETIQEENEIRRDNGLDTSQESIAQAVALKVGHKNVASIRAYTSSHAAGEVARNKATKMRNERRLQAENEQLRVENARLKNLLDKP